MFDLLVRYRNLLLVTLLIIQPLILILLSRQAEEQQVGPLGNVLLQTLSNGQNAAYQAVGGIGDFWDDYIRLVDVNRENQRLRTEVNRLDEERVRLIGVMQENARLRELLEFQGAHPNLSLRPAHVIAKDNTPYFRVIRIRLDVGDTIVRSGMPVVASSGLVGQITEVTGDYCVVMLTMDSNSRVDVLVQRTRARGMVEGLGHDDDYNGRIAYLLARDEVQIGDVSPDIRLTLEQRLCDSLSDFGWGMLLQAIYLVDLAAEGSQGEEGSGGLQQPAVHTRNRSLRRDPAQHARPARLACPPGHARVSAQQFATIVHRAGVHGELRGNSAIR